MNIMLCIARVWFADIGGYDADLPLAHIVLWTRNNLEWPI